MPQAEPIPIVAVGAVVVDGSGRVLLVRRARPPAVGTWTLPGGHLESGESREAAIVREVLEETALCTSVVCPLGVVPIVGEGFAYAIHEYLLAPRDDHSSRFDHTASGATDVPPPRLVAGDDAADARWVCRAELDPLGVRPDVIEVIDRGLAEAALRRQSPNETR